ncbi:MAG TPA: hypothetical protein PLA74_09580 [Syntrophales bacterium]|nr:hypothetical protein [Syntrophales bacterium]
MKKETPAGGKPKKAYEKPVLIRYQNLKTVTAGTEQDSLNVLGCARAY